MSPSRRMMDVSTVTFQVMPRRIGQRCLGIAKYRYRDPTIITFIFQRTQLAHDDTHGTTHQGGKHKNCRHG